LLRRSDAAPLGESFDLSAAREPEILRVARLGGRDHASTTDGAAFTPASTPRPPAFDRTGARAPSGELEFELEGGRDDSDAPPAERALDLPDLEAEPGAAAEFDSGAAAMEPALDFPGPQLESDSESSFPPALGTEADLLERTQLPPLSQLLSLLPQRPKPLEDSARPPPLPPLEDSASPLPPLARAPARARSPSEPSAVDRIVLPPLLSAPPPPLPPPPARATSLAAPGPAAGGRPAPPGRPSAAAPSARARGHDLPLIAPLPDLELAFRREPAAGAPRQRARADSPAPTRMREDPTGSRALAGSARGTRGDDARIDSLVPLAGRQLSKRPAVSQPVQLRARGLALAELLAGVVVLYLGIRWGNSVFHGEANLTSIVLHGFAFYALGAAAVGLRP